MRNWIKKAAGHIRMEKALDAVLLLLLLLLFMQCGVYMARFTEIRRASSDVPFDMRMLSATSSEGNTELDSTLLAPESIAIRTDGVSRVLYHSAAVVEEIYGSVNECLYFALSGEPMLVSPDLWRSSLDEEGVFVQYSAELPYQVICAFAAAHENSAELPRRGDVYVGVRELLLRPDKNGNFRDVLVRGSSGVYRFALSTERTYADFASYPTVYSDVFYRAEMTDAGDRMIVSSPDALSARAVHTVRGVTSLLTLDANFLHLLNFNPDKLNYHTEPNGNIVYVESHGIMRIGEDELNYQAADPGGIDMTSLGVEQSDIYACLRAASGLIDRLEKINGQYTGGDASLCLEHISSDGASITLFFAFRCDNILLVREGDDYGLTLTFSGNKLTYVRYRMCIVRRTLESRRVPLQDWYRQMLGGVKNTPMRLVYNGEEEANAVTAQWMRMDGGFWEQGGEIPWDGRN